LTLYQAGAITMDDAMSMAANAHDFKIKLRQLGISTQKAAESGIY
jgi:Tfp pilus assembly ATPase PilU